MLRPASALLLLLLAAPSVHACWSYVPLEHIVGSAEYVLHVKDGSKTYAPDYAVCRISELLFGLVVTDGNGCVRITSVSPRNTRHMSTDVYYAVGDELTLIAAEPEVINGKGMMFEGGGHPSQRTQGNPSRRLRKVLQARMDDAYALLDDFDKLVPGARAAAEAAVIEFEDGQRQDYKNLSPEADLLLDLVATNRGAPAEARAPRRDLDASTRQRLRVLSLRALCDISEVAAKAALPLLGGDGHGAEAMLAPADIKLETALASLQKLDDLGDLGAVLPQLVRHDVAERALEWSAHLVLKGGYAGKLGEWIWIEYASNTPYAYRSLGRFLAPAQTRDFPYADADARLLAGLIDAEAWALITLYQSINGFEMPEPIGEQTDAKTHETRVKALESLDQEPAYLAVYTFLRAITADDDKGLAHMRKCIEQQQRYKGDSHVDLDDFSALEWRVRMDYGNLPRAIELAIRNAE